MSSHYKLRRVEVGPSLNTSRIDHHLAGYEPRTQSAAQPTAISVRLWLSLRNGFHPLTLRIYAILQHVTRYSCLMHVGELVWSKRSLLHINTNFSYPPSLLSLLPTFTCKIQRLSSDVLYNARPIHRTHRRAATCRQLRLLYFRHTGNTSQCLCARNIQIKQRL